MPKPQRSRFKGSTPADPTVSDYLRRIRDDSNPDTEWIEVSATVRGKGTLDFENGWDNTGGGLANFAFRMTEDGSVEIEGACTGGADNTIVFTLPEGFRPRDSKRFPIPGSLNYFQIDSDGAVNYVVP